MLGFSAGVDCGEFLVVAGACNRHGGGTGRHALVAGIDRILGRSAVSLDRRQSAAALAPGLPLECAEGPHTAWCKSSLLVLAITLHNIPEGLAIGIAFGAVTHGLESATPGGPAALAIGIALQNFRKARRWRRRCGWKGDGAHQGLSLGTVFGAG